MDQINTKNIDQWLFNNAEGDLSAQEVEELNNYLELNPSLTDEQELWNQANFESIQIEEYPRLVAIQKGRGPWWKKALFFFAITVVALFLVLFYLFQFSNNETSIDGARGIGETENVKEKSVITPNDTLQTQIDRSASVSSESFIARKSSRDKVPEAIDSQPSVNLDRTIWIPLKLPIQRPAQIDTNKQKLIPMPSSERELVSSEKPNLTRSRKERRTFKKSKRKAAKKAFEQSSSRGHDPKIIPIESIGF